VIKLGGICINHGDIVDFAVPESGIGDFVFGALIFQVRVGE